MSANRDKDQRASFVYSNLYQLYQKGKEAAKEATVDAVLPPPPPEETQPGLTIRTPAGHVLRSEELKKVQIRNYEPVQLLGRRVQALDTRPISTKLEAKQALQQPARVSEPIKSLKENLGRLQDLHSRLDFMLKELEDLMK